MDICTENPYPKALYLKLIKVLKSSKYNLKANLPLFQNAARKSSEFLLTAYHIFSLGEGESFM